VDDDIQTTNRREHMTDTMGKLYGGYTSRKRCNAIVCIFMILLVLPLTVSALAPVADFSADPLSGTTATYFTFADASTNTPTSWLWEFSDDSGVNWWTLSTDQNPYTQLSGGSYSIRLTATNDDGSDDETKIDYITVTVAPTITVDSITPNTGVNNTLVHVVVTGTNFTSGGAEGFIIYNDDNFIEIEGSNFIINSEFEFEGDLDFVNSAYPPPALAGNYYLVVRAISSGIDFSDIIFTVTSESEPTPTPTETIPVISLSPHQNDPIVASSLPIVGSIIIILSITMLVGTLITLKTGRLDAFILIGEIITLIIVAILLVLLPGVLYSATMGGI
jgi:PKD repeat protein